MSTSPLTPALTQIPGNSAGIDSHANRSLQIGQVLFGKVLRVYQDKSYLVDLNGQQHVVDSTIPLRQDEVFRGKIVSLGERVVLEKIVAPDSSAIEENTLPSSGLLDRGLTADLNAFIQQHQNIFSTRDWNTLIRAAKKTDSPQTVLASAVYLQKLSLPFNVSMAVNLSNYLLNDSQLRSTLLKETLHLNTALKLSHDAAPNEVTIPLLADFIRKRADESLDHIRSVLQQAKSASPESSSTIQAVHQRDTDNAGDLFDQAVVQWLLNVQAGGVVAHRVIILPLVIDGNLVELEMALFDQNENTDIASQLKSKVIHLSLSLESFGKLGVTVNSVNKNLRVLFTSEEERGLQSLATHNRELTHQLEQLNFRVDELKYQTNTQGFSSSIPQSVVDMVVNTNSFSVLV